MNNNTDLHAVMKLIRPYQWVKNLFVYMALIFGGRLLDTSSWLHVTIAAACFCIASSAIYCLNDIIDAPADRLDPRKRFRPVASGAVSPATAGWIGAVLGIAAMGTSYLLLPAGATAVLIAYLIINVAYCLRLKNIPLLDVIIIALGFVLRVAMGGLAASIWISQWIIIMVFLLALFLAIAKRRHETLQVERQEKESGRPSIEKYNIAFLDTALCLIAAVTLIGYIIYTLQPRTIEQFHTDYLYVTALPVLIGILRYLQLTIVDNATGDPSEVAFSDRPLQLTVIVWLALFILIIYVL